MKAHIRRCMLKMVGSSLLAGTMAAAYAAELVAFVENSVPKISIVLPEKPSETEKLAAKELSEHLNKISGAVIQQGAAPAAGLIPVYIGEAADSELKKKTETPDSFCLSIKPGRVDLAGKGDGALFAVYELLEQAGVRWFMPGELGTVMPDAKTISLPVQTTIQSPSFTGRHFQMPEPG